MDWLEILIVAALMTLLTVLLTGPGLWSSSWGWGDRKGKGPKQDRHKREK
jgi:hypothetical protein